MFSGVAEHICTLTPGTSALILDVRAFAQSALMGKSFLQVAVELAGEVRYLQPISVMGNWGFGPEVESHVQGQEVLGSIKDALMGWQEVSTGDASKHNALSLLLPPSALSSLTVPILDSQQVPALVILIGLPLASPSEVNSLDKLFVKNIGSLCLSTLAGHRDRKADKSKLTFISQIAHELRTPIHGLGGQFELLRDLCTPEELLKFSSLLAVSDVLLYSLRDILDDSLDFAKLSSDVERGTNLPLATNDVVDLTLLMAEITKSTWTRKIRWSSNGSVGGDGDGEHGFEKSEKLDVILEFAERPEGWAAKVNIGELRRIVSNIVSNSFTFTKEGYVRVALKAAPSPGVDGLTTLVVVVSDSGVGMTEDFLENGQIWVPFCQVDTFSPGCGLGMSIAQDLVTRMNGKISVQSKLGEGTTVEVYLPILLLNTSQPASAVVQVLTGELGGLKRQIKQRYTSRHGFRLPTDTSTLPPHLSVSKNDDMYDQDLEALSPCTNQIQNPIYIVDLPPLVLSTSPVLTASGIRIFAAEDNTVARNVLQRFLTKKGYNVRAVDDGQKAVDEFKRGQYRQMISVLDIGMPIKDGLQAAQEIRRYEMEMGWPRHKIIALTALACDMQQVGVGGPFDDWIVKGGKALRTLEASLAEWQSELDGELTRGIYA